ncbi:MAG: hypothetical protein JWO45_1607 [Spartobacteria bacterium]|nr:hypothetical protein [Spartobacteria bacterium]
MSVLARMGTPAFRAQNTSRLFTVKLVNQWWLRCQRHGVCKIGLGRAPVRQFHLMSEAH